jgi:glucuronokinase
MMIRTFAHARAALIGNPSDGYNGKTISFTFSNFFAEVELYETPELELLPNPSDHSLFSSIESLAYDVNQRGYYGGIRLIKATIKRFYDYCLENDLYLHKSNFTIRYKSNIPHLVGLAGSSAIVTSCMKALLEFYDVSVPKPILAETILEVETQELGISAGLQDRVAQVYQGLVYMDFDKDLMKKQGYGNYKNIDANLLPNLYIAYQKDLSEISGIVHSDLRSRYNRKNEEVHNAMDFWAGLTDKVYDMIIDGKGDDIGDLLNANFDMREKICNISDGNISMIQAARSAGASAKFTGSGGAIIGTYKDEDMFEKIVQKTRKLGVEVIKPEIVI